MDTEMSDKQPARLLPETVKAIQNYRKAVKRETGKKAPSINAAINALILIGWDSAQKREAITTEKEAQS